MNKLVSKKNDCNSWEPHYTFINVYKLCCLCFKAFSSLAESAYDAAAVDMPDDYPETYCMSGVYEKVVEKLLQTTDR